MLHRRKITLIISAICLLLNVNCNSQSSSNAGIYPPTDSRNSSETNAGSTSFSAGKDYTEFTRARIMDKVGFQEPVEAFSILLPIKWTFDGGILWNPPGSTCAGTNMGMKAVSPDGAYSFEMMPNYMWSYIDDPQLAQFSQQQSFPPYCSFGEPLNADEYFKRAFAPNELGNPRIISTQESSAGVQTLKENGEKTRQELLRYGASQVNFYPSGVHAQISWGNGSDAIVLCGVTIIETFIPNIYTGTYNKSYTSMASERVVFTYPAGEYETAASMLSVVMGSIRTNPAWKSTVDDFWRGVREQSNRVHIGRLAMMDEQTKKMGQAAIEKGNANLNAMDANMRSWEASQKSQDRIHTDFVKSIREVENYRDETGKVEMVSGYNHAWSKSDGSSFIMTDNPNFDPSSVFQDHRWTEMKKVDY